MYFRHSCTCHLSSQVGGKARGANLGARWRGLEARAGDRREGREVTSRKGRRRNRREGEVEEELEGREEVGQVEHLTRMVEVGEDCWGLVREHLGEQHERSPPPPGKKHGPIVHF